MEQVLMRDAQRWVAPATAWIEARDGALWVTRSGDPNDHFLRRGERLAVCRGDDLVLQSLRRDEPAVWDWQARDVRAAARRERTPRRRLAPTPPVAPLWLRQALAGALHAGARSLDALASRVGTMGA